MSQASLAASGGVGQVVLVALFAGATVLAADILLVRVCPLLPEREEVGDGVLEYERSDPDTLVLGSSHARAFDVLEEELHRRTGGEHVVVRIPVEWGKHTSYRWVVEHRLRPVIEETDVRGKLVRPSLSRLLYVTEWWDGCAPPGGEAFNLPSRAWTLRHFLGDLAANGLTSYNRNYVTRRFDALLRWSILAQDRGVQRLPSALLELVRPVSEESRRAKWEQQVELWHRLSEGAYEDPLCSDGAELRAMAEVVDYFLGRGVEVTILLMARMPSTLTEKGVRTTFARYERDVRSLAGARGIRVIDWTRSTPLGDDHFMADFDHTTAEANRILAEWGLAGDLAFLLPGSGDQQSGNGRKAGAP